MEGRGGATGTVPVEEELARQALSVQHAYRNYIVLHMSSGQSRAKAPTHATQNKPPGADRTGRTASQTATIHFISWCLVLHPHHKGDGELRSVSHAVSSHPIPHPQSRSPGIPPAAVVSAEKLNVRPMLDTAVMSIQ